jgi:membrane-associated protease RseP (regulator of RpoE activity)
MRRVHLVIVFTLFLTAIPSTVLRAAEPTTAAAPPQQREWTFLGAALGEPTAEQRRQFKIGDATGAFVNLVMVESPAAKADIRAGDFITRAGDVDITSGTQMRDLVRARQAGETMTIDLLRDGQKLQVTATLEKRVMSDRPDPPVPARRRPTTTTTRPSTSPSARAPWSQATDVGPEDLVPEPYRVHAGDVLKVEVGDLTAPGVETMLVQRVSPAGTISLPLIGAVQVAGLTEEEVNAVVWQAMRHLCL